MFIVWKNLIYVKYENKDITSEKERERMQDNIIKSFSNFLELIIDWKIYRSGCAISLSSTIAETDVSSGYTVLSVAERREGKRVRGHNESSIAASGYIVIIARSVSVVDDKDEREKLKRISPNCRPLVHSLGFGVVCHRSLFFSLMSMSRMKD